MSQSRQPVKRKERPRGAGAADEHIVVSSGLHKRLKIETAHRGTSIKELVEAAVENYLASPAQKKAGAA